LKVVEEETSTPNPYDNKQHGEMFFPCRHVIIADDRKERAEKNDPRSCDSPLLPFQEEHLFVPRCAVYFFLFLISLGAAEPAHLLSFFLSVRRAGSLATCPSVI
jgi:hypothetical protein